MFAPIELRSLVSQVLQLKCRLLALVFFVDNLDGDGPTNDLVLGEED